MGADPGYLDEDTRDTLAAGRQTAGEMLVAARSKLRRVFIIFVVGLLGTIYAMRVWIWPTLERDLLALGADVVVLTPFDVILLQAKIGIIVGILMCIPPLLFYSREPLRERGWWPEDHVPRWKLVGIAAMSVLLFTAGITYSYNIFFPIMFDFLADNAISAGLEPTYSIVDWTEFILVLALSFGVAAQLPLAMTALSYSGIVPYETFRDKWKYAVLAMFSFGAMFSPPDPFTLFMWAMPLLALYGFSLYLSRMAVALKRGGEEVDFKGSIRSNANRLAAVFVLAAGLAAWFVTSGLVIVNRSVLPRLPAAYRPDPITSSAILPAEGTLGIALVAVPFGLFAAVLAALYYLWPSFEEAEPPGAPGEIDLGPLDAAGVRSAPPEAFEELEEDDAVALAGEAMDDDEPEKARAILDRFDEVQTAEEADDDGEDQEATDPTAAAAEPANPMESTGDRLSRATAGIVEAVRDEETTEDDIGGYYHDFAFILDSLRSKTFRIFVVFIGVLAGIFTALYMGGIGAIRNDFLQRLPSEVRPEDVSIITLHPVEALIFMVKISTLLGIVSTIPLLLYYAWPALRERGLASGDRNIFFGWAGAIFAGILVGSALGYAYVAPAIVSYLVNDALRADMIIAYRVSNFFWLLFFTTVGIGLWVDIPVSMVLFHRGGIVTYSAMREHWRVATVIVLAGTAIFTPASVLSMVLVTIPVMLAYALGLGILWVYTLGGRRAPRVTPESG